MVYQCSIHDVTEPDFEQYGRNTYIHIHEGILMKDFIRRIALSLSTGYILFYFSELLFWAKYRPDSMAPGELFCTYAVYSLLTFVFLSILWTFRV